VAKHKGQAVHCTRCNCAKVLHKSDGKCSWCNCLEFTIREHELTMDCWCKPHAVAYGDKVAK